MAGYETFVSVTRKGVALPAPLNMVPCRISYNSHIEVAADGKRIPVYEYWFHSRVGVPDIEQGDLLIDIGSSPARGTQYRVSGLPQPTDSSFLRVWIEKQVAKTP
jgi:hypothetical protein